MGSLCAIAVVFDRTTKECHKIQICELTDLGVRKEKGSLTSLLSTKIEFALSSRLSKMLESQTF